MMNDAKHTQHRKLHHGHTPNVEDVARYAVVECVPAATKVAAAETLFPPPAQQRKLGLSICARYLGSQATVRSPSASSGVQHKTAPKRAANTVQARSMPNVSSVSVVCANGGCVSSARQPAWGSSSQHRRIFCSINRRIAQQSHAIRAAPAAVHIQTVGVPRSSHNPSHTKQRVSPDLSSKDSRPPHKPRARRAETEHARTLTVKGPS
jgi:hypothetical protein